MGPLAGVKIVEMAGVGPAPFAGMMLADMGADVVRIDRKPSREKDAFDALASGAALDRGRRSIALDLKKPEAVAAALEIVAGADALIEGFRPGVMERLGLGPDVCLARNPRLIYGRVTGWGQEGPLSANVGHDIDYIALTGALHAIGAKDAPAVPLNLLGDFGGGAMFLAFGVVCALIEARSSGRGQVVDAAMSDAASLLMAMTYQLKAGGLWRNARQANVLDGGAPFYGVYRCADGKWVAVGALESQFFDALAGGLGFEAGAFADRWNPALVAGDEGALRGGFRRADARRVGGAVRRIRTPASCRCSISTRRRAIPITSRARPSSTSKARRSRRRRRGFRARRRISAVRPPRSAPTGRRFCAKSVSRPNESTR